MDSQSSKHWILTPFNYVDWREDMQLSFHNNGYFRIILGRNSKPHHPVEKNKFLNRLDEAFGYLCTHIYRHLLFHLKGLRNPKEYWEKLEFLFGKQDELWGHILENELIALHLSSLRPYNNSLQNSSLLHFNADSAELKERMSNMCSSYSTDWVLSIM